MSAEGIAVDVLVWLAVAATLVCVLGLLAARRAIDRLHFAAAASTLPPLLVAAAVWVAEGLTQPSLNATFVALVLVFLNPLLTHETARALRKAEAGTLAPRSSERTSS